MANPNMPEHSKGNPNQPKSAQSAGGHESYHFRCADAGFNDCPWEAKGSSPDEVMHKAEQHGREQHHLSHIDEATRSKVRSKIHKAA